tara:strand:- start:395 stop:613 length:219 start_codon:yes stop_codon:yes gene_type:complete
MQGGGAYKAVILSANDVGQISVVSAAAIQDPLSNFDRTTWRTYAGVVYKRRAIFSIDTTNVEVVWRSSVSNV